MLTDDPVPYLPYEESVAGDGIDPGHELRAIPRKWFFHFAEPNHQHLIGASRAHDPTLQGLTTARIGTNWSWVFVERVVGSAPRPGDREWVFNGEVTAHEIAHQWQVNPTRSGGHCPYLRWNSPRLYCSMHGDYGVAAEPCHGTCPEFFDGQVGFHYASSRDSEYLTIRQRLEPIPQF